MDTRNIRTGLIIPTESYCDQPYIVKTDDGAWLLVLTTGLGEEGAAGQHVVTMRSFDRGQTWIDRTDVESADGPEASYAVLLKAPSGRIYCFYNHNTDNLRAVKADFPGGYWSRVDSLGHHVFRYSDDGGCTWSPERIDIPIRTTQIDRDNPYGGEIKFFWNVGRPLLIGGEVYLTLHKIGRFGPNAFETSEGVLLHSADLLTCPDPASASWEMLPDGETGLRSPEGPVAEEQNLTLLSDGSLFCCFRSVAGNPVCAYSRDRGRTWTQPEFMIYPDGRRMKHPRAANFVWKRKAGGYLYWFHNQGGCDFTGRNPAWLSYGTEYDAPDGKRIRWSDPEILLYDPENATRMSYPDLVQEDGEYYFTETQKTIARLHQVDRTLIDGMAEPVLPQDGRPIGGAFAPGTGFSLVMDVCTDGELTRIEGADGMLILLEAKDSRLRLTVDDGETVTLAFSDRMTPGAHRAAVIADMQAKIITFVIDGVLSDGETRPRGWFRLASSVRGGRFTRTPEGLFYPRPLRHFEARLLTNS